MNKMIVFASLLVSAVLIHFGMSTQKRIGDLNSEYLHLHGSNLDMAQKIKEKEVLQRQNPVPIATAYSVLLNQIRLLESNSGTSMNIQLEGSMDSQDIASHYEDTEYKGIRGLKIRILVDKISKETDMGAVLGDIFLLGKNTDFRASEIKEDNNFLVVKGEVYGL